MQLKIKATDGPCKGQIFQQSIGDPISYRVGDILTMIKKKDFKINPFWQDVHDVFNPHNQFNPITQECYRYILLKDKNKGVYLKYVP